ncbi:hypothetical protein BD309DRAFT_967204 [Dichomitus squalens]|nr:hypothetical protein BD309DRAFT_967204 [Dichomitus squalens]
MPPRHGVRPPTTHHSILLRTVPVPVASSVIMTAFPLVLVSLLSIFALSGETQATLVGGNVAASAQIVQPIAEPFVPVTPVAPVVQPVVPVAPVVQPVVPVAPIVQPVVPVVPVIPVVQPVVPVLPVYQVVRPVVPVIPVVQPVLGAVGYGAGVSPLY